MSDGLSRREAREAASQAGEDDGPEAAPSAAEREAEAAKGTIRNTIEWIAVIAGAIVIAIVVRTFVLQTFYIPSPSMVPTLKVDDRVLVNKLSYRLHDVNRGDVVVFERPPTEPESEVKDLIKRVIGLGGERISIIDGAVRIDGKLLSEPYIDGLQTVYDSGCSTVDLTGIATEDGFLIPEDHLFVMGDNRGDSRDARCFGPISEDLVVGRAFFIIWPPGSAGGL